MSAFKKAISAGRPLAGIDYGTVRIGVSLSDKALESASAFKIIAKLRELDDIVSSRNITGFVVGLPLQTDGTEGEMAGQARLFAARLAEKYQLPVYFADERYSSIQAEENLVSTFMRPRKRAAKLDAEAARILLQRVLNQLKEIEK